MRIDTSQLVAQIVLRDLKKNYNINAKQMYWLQAIRLYLRRTNEYSSAGILGRFFPISTRVNDIYDCLAHLEKEGYIEYIHKGRKFVPGDSSLYTITAKGRNAIEFYDKNVSSVTRELEAFGNFEF
ncbi:MAG: hypothetical protein ACXWFB_12355 [Nitrososphaeraceae archaeon]